MKRTCCNTLTILVAGLLLAGPALGNGGPSVSENKALGDSSAAVGKDSSSTLSESQSPGRSGQAVGKDSSSMSGTKDTGNTSVSSASKVRDSRLAATSMNDNQVRELQRLLGERGYSPGKIDGIIGPRTQAAIRQFQTANELTVNGKPGQETLRVLAPDAKKQEFFGVAPAYGEAEGVKQQPINKEQGAQGIDEQMKNQPAERMDQPLNQPTNRTEQPLKNEPAKKGY